MTWGQSSGEQVVDGQVVDGTQVSAERGERSRARVDPGVLFILVMGLLLALQLLWVVSTLSWAAVDPPANRSAVIRPLNPDQAARAARP